MVSVLRCALLATVLGSITCRVIQFPYFRRAAANPRVRVLSNMAIHDADTIKISGGPGRRGTAGRLSGTAGGSRRRSSLLSQLAGLGLTDSLDGIAGIGRQVSPFGLAGVGLGGVMAHGGVLGGTVGQRGAFLLQDPLDMPDPVVPDSDVFFAPRGQVRSLRHANALRQMADADQMVVV